ncbi:MAG: hypothetical protein ACRC67_04745 [Inquilinus sp.]|uniref:hypothetical protein n=1 Tax=Inquilinus sp. TaxID=1932117 RepID=UPI003F308E18
MEPPHHLEVGRRAHELAVTHGPGAHRYAARLAEEALGRGEADAHRFWKAVEAALTPRRGYDVALRTEASD